MPAWKESLRNFLKERRAYIIVMLVTAGALFAIMRWSTALPALEFNDVTGDSLQDLFFSSVVAWIIPKDALSSCFSTQGIT